MDQLKLEMIENAKKRLRDVIHITPLDRSQTFSNITQGEVYLKYENLQKTGSFKIRGAYNKLCDLKESANVKNIIASSAGNHAQGVAYAASKLGFKSTIFMPKSTPIAKVAATESYGAEVRLHGSDYDSAYEKAMEEMSNNPESAFIHPFDDLSVIAGQGTIGMEILKELPDVDAVLLPAGGGGLLAGVAFYMKNINPRIKIIGVQAEGANAIYSSFHENKSVNLETVSTIADGIAVKNPGKITQSIINEYVDDMITVSDSEISSAILLLLERCKQMVEPAGAASLAAAISAKTDLKNKKTACVLSGGNVDVSFIHRIIEIGLLARDRKLRFKTIMKDIPGSLEKFAAVMADEFANIVMVQYDRMYADLDPNEVILHIACEVRDKAHGNKVLAALEREGFRVIK